LFSFSKSIHKACKAWAKNSTNTYIERIVMPLKTSDEKQDLILKVFDYFEAKSKLSLGESEMNISCMLGFW
jgi:hypothetical protein